MDFYQYEKAVARTAAARQDNPQMQLAVLGLGLTGEAGEGADIIKKHIGHGHPLDRSKLAKELGDVLWYLAAIAQVIGYDLEEIAQMNIDKLRARYPEGFSTEASLARRDLIIGSDNHTAHVGTMLHLNKMNDPFF